MTAVGGLRYLLPSILIAILSPDLDTVLVRQVFEFSSPARVF